MLTLTIKKKWFDMIKSGEKKEEYRKINTYYTSRFFSNFNASGIGLEYILKNDVEVNMFLKLRNGYKKDSPSIICYCHINKGYGKEEWGAEPGKLYYVLKILSVEEVK